MRPSAVTVPLVAAALAHAALHVPVTRYHKRDASSAVPFNRVAAAASNSPGTTTGFGSLSVINSQNILYITDLTIGNTNIPIILDTGSTDLWIDVTKFPGLLSNAQNHTDIALNLTYGIGSALGFVSVTDIEFADIPVPNQALLAVLKTDQQDALYDAGAFGILGLGSNTLSNIYLAMQKKYGDNRGQSVLSNIFSANASEPNHFAIFLDRMGDLDNSAHGTFSLGTYNPSYSAVQNQPELPLAVPDASSGARWSTVIDAVELSGKNVTLGKSTVSGVQSGKAVALFDTGATLMYIPKDMADTWFKSIPDIVYVSTQDVYFVPCNAELEVAIWIKGNRYPIHPLDITKPVAAPLFSFPNSTYCMMQILPMDTSISDGAFDLWLGEVFLRNAYSVFDFGDTDPSTNKTGVPYMKFLSITDENAATGDFRTSRNQSLAALPALGNLTAVAAADKQTNPSGTPGGGPSVEDDVNKLVGWAPAMLGLLGFNALALLMLVVIGVMLLRRGKRDTSAGAPRYQPVHLPPKHAPYEEPLYEEHRYNDA
ncbi:hypothetical protein BOTBODRAFT_172365 [Botryobasidium botryosum FD-172 SS1]|uniref:Peptidase A1 domain-containing protein n=1 Tax=Botryobasidium botryosum (strain FD-172 SS1) TaxID=930990 RepID=A0A067MP69_BOTB1|nr:hypothetical protein BOTBODRAFT_172365 [Botryobasidium botryosum FD-172 SS1]